MGGKQYKSVLEMVRDTSGKKFADRFEKLLRKKTVYVHVHQDQIQVFKSKKAAKKYAGCETWEKGDEKWVSGDHVIYRKKIVLC